MIFTAFQKNGSRGYNRFMHTCLYRKRKAEGFGGKEFCAILSCGAWVPNSKEIFIKGIVGKYNNDGL